MNWPACPATLKPIQPILKIAQEHDDRDIVVSYWARVYALQIGLKLSTHQEDEMKLLVAVMDWLEQTKKTHADNEAVVQEVVSQAHLENYALKLFMYADKQDRSCNWNKNVVKAFYSAAVLYDVMQVFGELTEEVTQNRKYAKWKASYIHNCLKNGETPVPGPMQENSDETGAEQPEDTDENAAENEQNEQNINAPNDQPTTPQSPVVSPVNPPPFTPPSQPISPENIPNNLPTETPQTPTTSAAVKPIPRADANHIIQAQKHCKYAASALNYDDVSTAITELQKALAMLTNSNT